MRVAGKYTCSRARGGPPVSRVVATGAGLIQGVTYARVIQGVTKAGGQGGGELLATLDEVVAKAFVYTFAAVHHRKQSTNRRALIIVTAPVPFQHQSLQTDLLPFRFFSQTAAGMASTL